MEMTHKENLSMNRHGVEVRSMDYQHWIEGVWGILKYHTKHIYNTRSGDISTIEDYLYESVWRRNKGKIPLAEQDGFIIASYTNMMLYFN